MVTEAKRARRQNVHMGKKDTRQEKKAETQSESMHTKDSAQVWSETEKASLPLEWSFPS